MDKSDELEVCLRCGKTIHRYYPVSIQTIAKLSKLKPQEFVSTICEHENLDEELAQEFVDHKMGFNCIKTEPPCPNCHHHLRTWRANYCLKCGWRRDPSRNLSEYY